MIRPILEYCAGAWACCGKVNNGTLEALQKRVGRIVMKTSSSDTAMEASKWPSLRTRRDEHILKLVRKCIDSRVLNILITILFSINTFALAQPGRAIFYVCLQ